MNLHLKPSGGRLRITNSSQLVREGHPDVLLDLQHVMLRDLQGELDDVVLVSLLAHPQRLLGGQAVRHVRLAVPLRLRVQPEALVALAVRGRVELVVPVHLRAVGHLPVGHHPVDGGPVAEAVAELVHVQVERVDLKLNVESYRADLGYRLYIFFFLFLF